ncbi:hypothetical protein RQP46_010282 [Phenoliferia psychrophenolica]
MAPPQFHNDSGAGQTFSDTYGFSQAVVLGDIVKCSGQGGWDAAGSLPEDLTLAQEVTNAFDNIERALQAAGVKNGWAGVYSVRSYHVGIEEGFGLVVEGLKEKAKQRPIWTAVAVPALVLPTMHVEIEVEAYLGGK